LAEESPSVKRAKEVYNEINKITQHFTNPHLNLDNLIRATNAISTESDEQKKEGYRLGGKARPNFIIVKF